MTISDLDKDKIGIGDMDLLEGLRLEQTKRPQAVHLATLENSGRISVVRKTK